MAQLIFTQQLARFMEVPQVETGATDLRGALDAAFADHPRLRGYVLDEQGHLRENVIIFIDGQRTRERKLLNDALAPHSKVYILQALSGG
ncbi:MoaD/ThiS family protein [Duganella sp. BJB488]|uniref:MoaD/ThiS family protein n=1 Tax=unclassified Duganella TaxID=2636909 RepID=UPI000E351822|nr:MULTISPECIES: MoaD/ThiS family protein [unclassified Duganella]RFP24245.1 MoaD/ThiS family protein [Duganella sp. BJB489]RFP26605.1 MoaD/ThiS family protein [Duganella sp. BJB488]RFP34661.1 MoaD/ThiS family protein [Duganella sp. BJB480]